jgi:hypothetical protein
MGDSRGACRILLGRREGKRPVERPMRRWKDNNEMGFKEVGMGGMDWVYVAQDRGRWRALVSAVINLQIP